MVKSRRMQRIAHLSETAERAAAQALSLSQAEIDRCQKQLAELHEYRREYSRALTSGGAPLNGFQAQELRGFIARVDAAIGAVETRLKQSELSRNRERENWARHQRRTKALQDVAARAGGDEARHAEAQSQREVDDRAARGPRED